MLPFELEKGMPAVEKEDASVRLLADANQFNGQPYLGTDQTGFRATGDANPQEFPTGLWATGDAYPNGNQTALQRVPNNYPQVG
jgi:hypothetical protein